MIAMKSACAFGVLLAILCSFIKSGDFLMCYECNSHTNHNCSWVKPPNNTQIDCSKKTDGNKYTMCRKVVQTIDFEVNGLQPNTRTIRSCAWDDSQYKDTCYQRSGFGGRQDVCSCSTPLCNGSSLTYADYKNVIFGSIVAIIMVSLPLR